jgi:hypothetical protein
MATTSIGAPGVTFPDSTVQSSAGATGVPVINVYTSPGTWTKPATVKAIKVTITGGGAGGTGAYFTPASAAQGAGGGAGGTAIRVYPASSLPAPGPQPYTIGAAVAANTSGNPSSFGNPSITILTANAGSVGRTNSPGGFYGYGGGGGTASGGQINMRGGPGTQGGITSTNSVGGTGGASFFDGGGNSNPNSPTINSGQYGSGGAGESSPGIGATGGGGSGIIVIEEFY